MRETRSKEIDGFTFTVQQLPARRGAKLEIKLTRILGPGVLRSLSGVKLSASKLADVDLNLSDLANGLEDVFTKFSENDFDSLINELFETSTISQNGKTVQLLPVVDEWLAGHPETLFKAVKFALEVNFGNFISALLGKLAGLTA